MKTQTNLRIALVREVFHGDRRSQLAAMVSSASDAGAQLAVLPELPLLPWIPCSRESREEDAERLLGATNQSLSDAARSSKIGLVGGAITLDSRARRFNTAMVFDKAGELLGSYQKVHLPEEEGFWETSHYQPSTNFPTVFRIEGFPIGVQICSDINRPTGSFVLASCGAAAILVPRATEAETFDRWRLTLRAVAMQTASYVLSVPRPRTEGGVSLGGPSIAVGPDGNVIEESEEPLLVVDLDQEHIAEWRRRYPGYLDVPCRDYARWWMSAANERQ